ncbi:hypothetical protein L596_021268 [Steinernema carpocapsae]|uniref:NGN domain-containing protein n=1 Tax=Steinernema carpocapsae TaxID=34508 RepID=A0A4U5MI58_STECR|nr:hypothetical protein L596_021268 [Steinernema carpocapsae]
MTPSVGSKITQKQKHQNTNHQPKNDVLGQQVKFCGVTWSQTTKTRMRKKKKTERRKKRRAAAATRRSKKRRRRNRPKGSDFILDDVDVEEGLKGIVCIEAFKKTHVAQAIEGISNLNPYVDNIKMVAIKEMVETLKVVKDIPHIKKGAFVRLKRTLYKEDFGFVWRRSPSA